MRPRLVGWFAAIALTCGARTVGATTILPMDLEDLTGLSRDVVTGQVVKKDVAWDATGSYVVTTYTLKTTRSLQGAPRSDLIIRAHGGQIDDLVMRVGGVPDFETGDEVLLFLDRQESRTFPVTGWEQGVFRLLPSSNGDSSVFTHDWRPVTGIEGRTLVVAPSLENTSESMMTPGADAGPPDDPRTLAASEAAGCMKLDAFFHTIREIRKQQEVHGYQWRYAHLFQQADPAEDLELTSSAAGDDRTAPLDPQGMAAPEDPEEDQ